MAFAAALSVENKWTNGAFRQEPRQMILCYVRKPLHRPKHLQVAPIANNNGDGDAFVSLQIDYGTFAERASRALKRRLRPKTTLSAYELSQTLGISEPTIWNILNGNSKSGPSGRVLDKLVEFFGASFLQEVFGGPNVHCIDPRDGKKASALRKLVEAQEELRRLG